MKIRKIGPNADLQDINNKKRNPYKIILFSIIILSTATFFGFKYFKTPATNVCLDSDTKVYDSYKNAVVLIKHRYGYFTKINGKEFQLTAEEAKEETVYGTGFFVNRDGKILTNSHVLQPWNSSNEEQEKVNTTIRNLRLKIASILTTDVSEDEYENFIERNWKIASAYDESEGEGEVVMKRVKKQAKSQRVKNLSAQVIQKQIPRQYQQILQHLFRLKNMYRRKISKFM